MNDQIHQKNERVRLTITDMGINGEGIGRIAGSSEAQNAGKRAAAPVFFVKNAVIGDEVLAVITKMKKGYGYAKVLEILRPSRERVQPACPLAERCGGCQIMQLSYEAQLRFKENKVRSDLERIAGIDGASVSSILPMDQDPPLHFRNKTQFPVGWDREGHVVTGFYAGRTHYIIASWSCPVSPQVNGTVLEAVRGFLEKRRIPAYHEETGSGLIRHVLIRNGFYTGQIMVCLVINGSGLDEDLLKGECPAGTSEAAEEELVRVLTGLTLPAPWRIACICLNSNCENTNVILGDQTRCLYGTPYIEDDIVSRRHDLKPLRFSIDPKSFFQTNPKQTVKLYDTVLDLAGLTGTETVWDLYCGIGTISLFLAQQARQVYGVEMVAEAIDNARENARRNRIRNAEFFCGKSEIVFPEKIKAPEGKNRADVVVLDPPRKGCAKELLDTICMVGPERIVYVSCDPATLARDLKILCGSGYRLERVQPVDMFPHTVHIETVCLLKHF